MDRVNNNQSDCVGANDAADSQAFRIDLGGGKSMQVRSASVRTSVKQYLMDLDGDGDKDIDFEDLMSAMRSRRQFADDGKKLRVGMCAVIAVAILVVVINSLATALTVQMTKDIFPRDEKLVDSKGQLIQTANADMKMCGNNSICSRNDADGNDHVLSTGSVRIPYLLNQIPLLPLEELVKMETIYFSDSGEKSVFHITNIFSNGTTAVLSVADGSLIVSLLEDSWTLELKHKDNNWIKSYDSRRLGLDWGRDNIDVGALGIST